MDKYIQRGELANHDNEFSLPVVLYSIRHGQVCVSGCKWLLGHGDLFLASLYFNDA